MHFDKQFWPVVCGIVEMTDSNAGATINLLKKNIPSAQDYALLNIFAQD